MTPWPLVLAALALPLGASAARAAAGSAPPADSQAASAEIDSWIAEICPYDADLCASYSGLKSSLDSLAARRPPEGRPRASVQQLIGFGSEFRAIIERSHAVYRGKRMKDETAERIFHAPILYLNDQFMTLTFEAVPRELDDISAGLDIQERRARTLEADLGRPKGLSENDRRRLAMRLYSINVDGTDLWNRLKEVSEHVDRLGRPIERNRSEYARGSGQSKTDLPLGVNLLGPWETAPRRSGAGELSAKADPLKERLARLARRLQDIEGLLSVEAFREAGKIVADLSDPFRSKPAPGAAPSAAVAAPPQSSRGAQVGAPVRPLLRGGLLDLRLPPPPKPSSNERLEEPFLTRLGSRFGFKERAGPLNTGGKFNAEPAATQWVERLRNRGLTWTAGEPGRRAKTTFMQGFKEGGVLFWSRWRTDTCGVAAQVMLLEEAGTVPSDPRNRKEWEKRLTQRAVEKGVFDRGTPHQFIDALLDIPVRKHYAASDEELFRAVKSGKMLIVTLDTDVLWNSPKFRGQGHSVAVTGAEIERFTGRVLGFYINDTGANQAARFVAVEQFLKAWGGRRIFIEPV